jgi:hypothetical protein
MHKLSTIFVMVKRALSHIRISAAKLSVIKFILAIIANLVTRDAAAKGSFTLTKIALS